MKTNGTAAKPAVVRCAIYTRKSTEEGLDQDFNSLDAQREGAEAFIHSQRGEGWTLLSERYDDGGFSGGTMVRPALTRLLDDIKRKHVDMVVVYKVDRLSRSLLDFARLIETFDKNGVSFVSVTQQFNTATSMGRLVLNVLLSFAQFEREMIAERTKDKMGAARRKGKWIGGRPALGYDIDYERGRLVVNADEAEQVRTLFRLYLQERSFRRVAQILNERGWRLKSWRNKDGKWVQGGEWDASAVHRHITNVTYLGKVCYEGQVYSGEHEAILDAATFDHAAAIRAEGRVDRGAESRNITGYLLRGLIHCKVCDSTMTTATSASHGRTYRYYSCIKANKRGRHACSVRSVPGPEIENFIVDQIRKMGWQPSMAAPVSKALSKTRYTQAAGFSAEQRRLGADLERVHHESKLLVDALTAEGADRPIVIERMRGLESRSEQIEKRLNTVIRAGLALDRLEVNEARVAEVLGSFSRIWEAFSTRERARMLHLLIERIVYDGSQGQMRIDFGEAGASALVMPATPEGEGASQGAA